jgi:hypothetical protein
MTTTGIKRAKHKANTTTTPTNPEMPNTIKNATAPTPITFHNDIKITNSYKNGNKQLIQSREYDQQTKRYDHQKQQQQHQQQQQQQPQ